MKFRKDLLEKLLDKLDVECDYEQVDVILEKFSRVQQCFSNVETKVKKDGGNIHYGWLLHTDSKYIYEAEFHAVWEKDDVLIDITPQDNKQRKSVLFVSDNDYPYDGKDVDNVRMNITSNKIVDDFIFICENIAKLYSLGIRLNDDKVQFDNPATLVIIQELEIRKSEIYSLLNHRQKFSSPCLCNSGKIYKLCHGGEELRSQVESQILKIGVLI